MLTPDVIRLLFQYNLWADRRTLDACAALTNEQFTRDLGSSFGSVRDTLAHLYGAEWLWNERFQGRLPSGLPPASAYPDLAAVRAKLEEMDHYYIDFVSKLTPQDLDRSFTTRPAGVGIFKSTVANPASTLESWHVSPRSSRHAVAATGREAGFHGLDRFLSRAGRGASA